MSQIKNAMSKIFHSIGGEKELAKILSEFYNRMEKDLLIGFFFRGKDVEQIAQNQRYFLMRAWGITSSYTGKPPATAHLSLPPILKGHFDRRLQVLRETLAHFGLSPEDIETWIAFEDRFREMIEAKE